VNIKLIALLSIALPLFPGCATREGQLMKRVNAANLHRLDVAYGTAEPEKDAQQGLADKHFDEQIKLAESDPTGKERNRVLEDLVLLLDLNYDHWEKLLYEKKAYADFAGALAVLGISSYGSVSTAATANQVLHAIAGGITGAQASFNENVLQRATMPALIQKMRALRAKRLTALKHGMYRLTQGDTIKVVIKGEEKEVHEKLVVPRKLSEYSMRQGLIDLAAYYNAGTFVAAIQDIHDQAAKEKQAADDKNAEVKPGAETKEATGAGT